MPAVATWRNSYINKLHEAASKNARCIIQNAAVARTVIRSVRSNHLVTTDPTKKARFPARYVLQLRVEKSKRVFRAYAIFLSLPSIPSDSIPFQPAYLQQPSPSDASTAS